MGGIYIHHDGTSYKGGFVDDVQDGSTYEGQWENNKLHGAGSYVGCDGRFFWGMWRESKMHGRGIYQWPDGRSYQGEYDNDQKAGFGIFTWDDGRRYEGYWSNGNQHGAGRLVHTCGFSRLAQWSNGERVAWFDGELTDENTTAQEDFPVVGNHFDRDDGELQELAMRADPW